MFFGPPRFFGGKYSNDPKTFLNFLELNSIQQDKIKNLNSNFLKKFWNGEDLDKLYKEISSDESMYGAMSLFKNSFDEYKSINFEQNNNELDLESINRSMRVSIASDEEEMNKHLSFLANVGSVSPYVGLLGTVWGIVNAFQSIAISNNTSLAVVAPGIAEALFATALGLLAAIPAVAAYNKFSNDLDKITSNLEYFSIEFLSKKLNEMEKKHNV